MPTFMTPATFSELAATRDHLNRTINPSHGMSNIFVPWAGSEMVKTKRGIYLVGIALNAGLAQTDQSLVARLKWTEGIWQAGHKSRRFGPS